MARTSLLLRFTLRSLGPVALGPVALGPVALGPTAAAQETWSQIQPPNSPSARWEHAMAQDSVLGRTVLFGGRQGSLTYLNDTWLYDGKTWTRVPTTSAPSGRWLSDMEFDRARLECVLFGGYIRGSSQADTWTFSIVSKQWTRRQPRNSPPARYGSSMTYDPDRQVVVMFGGQDGSKYLDDTWEWDGNDWTLIQTPGSPGVRGTSMAYDSLRQRMVIFGGAVQINRYDNETWEYDGIAWTRINTQNAPSPRGATAMEYDPASQRVILYGGFIQTFRNVDETWSFDGRTWTRLNPASRPSARRDFDNIVLDPLSNRIRIFGGYGTGENGDTWEFASNPLLSGSPATISVATGGTHTLRLRAGAAHANRSYLVVGSMSGTEPGTPLGPLTIPLRFDPWTSLTIAFANSPTLTRTRGILDVAGAATADLNVPRITDPSAVGLVLHHAFFVYDATNSYHLASNPIAFRLTR